MCYPPTGPHISPFSGCITVTSWFTIRYKPTIGADGQIIDSETNSQQAQHQQFLGDASAAIPNFGSIILGSDPLPEGITLDYISEFEELYKEHCEASYYGNLDKVKKLQNWEHPWDCLVINCSQLWGGSISETENSLLVLKRSLFRGGLNVEVVVMRGFILYVWTKLPFRQLWRGQSFVTCGLGVYVIGWKYCCWYKFK